MRTIRNRYADPVFTPTSIPIRRVIARQVEAVARAFTEDARAFFVSTCRLFALVAGTVVAAVGVCEALVHWVR